MSDYPMYDWLQQAYPDWWNESGELIEVQKFMLACDIWDAAINMARDELSKLSSPPLMA